MRDGTCLWDVSIVTVARSTHLFFQRTIVAPVDKYKAEPLWSSRYIGSRLTQVCWVEERLRVVSWTREPPLTARYRYRSGTGTSAGQYRSDGSPHTDGVAH